MMFLSGEGWRQREQTGRVQKGIVTVYKVVISWDYAGDKLLGVSGRDPQGRTAFPLRMRGTCNPGGFDGGSIVPVWARGLYKSLSAGRLISCREEERNSTLQENSIIISAAPET
jgi:hypothetical protein